MVKKWSPHDDNADNPDECDHITPRVIEIRMKIPIPLPEGQYNREFNAAGHEQQHNTAQHNKQQPTTNNHKNTNKTAHSTARGT